MEPRTQLAQSVHEKNAVAHAGKESGEAGESETVTEASEHSIPCN